MSDKEQRQWDLHRALDLIRRIKIEETHERYIDRHKAFDIAIELIEQEIEVDPTYKWGMHLCMST